MNEPAKIFQRPVKPKKEKPLPVVLQASKEFALAAARFGCPIDQIHNFLKAGIFLQPKQLQFAAYARECDKEGGATAIMCGGGRGSGKSNGIIAQIMVDDCQRFPGLKVLVLRKIGKANQEQIQDYRTKILAAIPHDYKQQAQEIHFLNGSKVLLGNFKDEKDIDRYMGQEYDLIYLMESNQLTFAKKKFIFTCLRTSKVGWRPRAYEDTNPGGVGMAENKQMYVIPWRQGREKETGTRYIHSTVYDNKFINKEYVTQLESLTGWQRKAWLDGDWDFAAGSFFTNFIPEHHVIDDSSSKFDFQNIRSVWLSFDHGFSHNSAAILHARDKNGIYCALDEYCEHEMTIPQLAGGIKEMLENHHYNVSDMDFCVAGKDCFSRNEDGRTIADAFDANGISFTPAEVDRVNGWKLMHSLFGDISNNTPAKGFIHKRCQNLIAQIGLAQHSLKKAGDIEKFNADSEGQNGDDALDACFVEGTMVWTEYGETPIELVRPNMFVWTRKGLRRVLATSKTNFSPVATLIFDDGRELTGTHNHRIHSEGKWIPLDSLRFGDSVTICQKQNLKPLCLTELSFAAIPMPNSWRTADIIRPLQTIGNKALVRFIKKFGNQLMEKYQKITISTTKTGIVWTTTSKTCNASWVEFIYRNMANLETLYKNENKWLTQRSLPLRLTKHQFSEIGQNKTGVSLWERLLLNALKLANIARLNTKSERRTISADFAVQNANSGQGQKAELTKSKKIVPLAEKNLNQTNTKTPKLADISVRSKIDGNWASVFNLEVEDCPEYFANGILVHNCRFGIASDPNHAIIFAKPVSLSRRPYQALGFG